MRRRIVLSAPADLGEWRDHARALVAMAVPPGEIDWGVAGEAGLFETAMGTAPVPGAPLSVPRRFAELAEQAIQHRDPVRFGLLYRLLWRLQAGERRLMEDALDPDVHAAGLLASAVRRDAHKMKAFVRFRAVGEPDQPRFLAWFEPEHHVLAATAPFFVRRFSAMLWSILTPGLSAHWDGAELRFAVGARKADVPGEDALEAYWRTYFASIFNPARLKISAMTAEMPKKYWKNLPEAALITPLIRDAARRSGDMVAAGPTAAAQRGRVAVLPRPQPGVTGDPLADLGVAIRGCRDCPLWQPATQAVCGEGPADAAVMLVGEQPGDTEDLAGRPFVGPAGRLLDRALAEAGLSRERLYLTNAVKHFKFEPRGKRRLHKTPGAGEIARCRGWLDREIALVRPRVLVALGASAARALLGRSVRIEEARGAALALGPTRMLVTVHPAYLLRLPDEARRAADYDRFVQDLRRAAADP
jgi:DNA polymerase